MAAGLGPDLRAAAPTASEPRSTSASTPGASGSPRGIDDALLGARLLEHLRRPAGVGSELVLEGGSITVDGEGTLITTEQCLLNPNRNSRSIAARSRPSSGARSAPARSSGSRSATPRTPTPTGMSTASARSCARASFWSSRARTPRTPTTRGCAPTAPCWRAARDARGRSLEIIELPLYPYGELGGHRTSVSYVNFYVANGGVIVPTAGDRDGPAGARARAAARCPDREVVGAPARCIAFGGGGVHCITQQMTA